MPPMNEPIYQLLVANIRRYSVWLTVADANGLQPSLNCPGGDCVMGIVPCLMLAVDIPRGNHQRGQLLSIPRYQLHQAARMIAAEDPGFRKRLATLEIDRHDVERIIQKASYGLIKPQLSDDWLSSPFFFK